MTEPFFPSSSSQSHHVDFDPAAGRTGNDVHSAMTKFQGLENFKTDLDFFHGIGGQRHSQGVSDPVRQQPAQSDGGFDGAGAGSPPPR